MKTIIFIIALAFFTRCSPDKGISETYKPKVYGKSNYGFDTINFKRDDLILYVSKDSLPLKLRNFIDSIYQVKQYHPPFVATVSDTTKKVVYLYTYHF